MIALYGSYIDALLHEQFKFTSSSTVSTSRQSKEEVKCYKAVYGDLFYEVDHYNEGVVTIN